MRPSIFGGTSATLLMPLSGGRPRVPAPGCGGELKIIAAIEDPAVIVRILSHLGLPARAPPRSPARLPELIQAA